MSRNRFSPELVMMDAHSEERCDARRSSSLVLPPCSGEFHADFPGICITNVDLHGVAVNESLTEFRDSRYPVVDCIHLDRFADGSWDIPPNWTSKAFSMA